MYQIFISYRRMGGEALAFLLHEKLTAIGYKVFYDIESLSSGRFDTKLLKVMDECTDVIVILPPNALDRCVNDGDWLYQEITHAIETKKNIIPLILKGFEFPKTLPVGIATLPSYQRVQVDFNYFDGVLEHIKKYIDTGNKSDGTGMDLPDASVKHILLWSDFDPGLLEKLVNKLELDEGYFPELLAEAVEILSKNLSLIDTIVLITTDVTKFTNNQSALDRLNQALVEYVKNGGRLICAHDVIYRRTRNTELQKMYGCQIVNFKQSKVVHYVKTDNCKDDQLFETIPDSFDLSDGEICWGELADDIDVYFETEDGIPLVFSREYGSGLCLYFNSGDYKNGAPKSIAKPEKQFVAMLREMIKFKY